MLIWIVNKLIHWKLRQGGQSASDLWHSSIVGRLNSIIHKNRALCDESMKFGTLRAKDSPKHFLISGHCEFSIWQPWQPYFKMATIY